MRLRRQLPDQLVGKAHADFHGVHVRPGEVFVVVTPAAAATGARGGERRAGNDHEVDLRRVARLRLGSRLGDAESPRTQRLRVVFAESHHIPFDARNHDAFHGAPPRQRLRRVRLVGKRAENTHRPGRAESLQPPGPAEYPARGFGALRSVHSEVPPAHRGAQFFFGHKTLLSGIKFPSVSIVIPQTMAIFACVK